MTKRQQTSTFERLAFESELRERPGDRNAADAFCDWLIDNGYAHLGARREVIRVVREATEEAQRVRVERFLNSDGVLPMTMRHAIRAELRTRQLPGMVLEVVRGGQKPTIVGDVAYWLGRDGLRYLEAERRAYPDVEMYYQPGRERIIVGAAWVLNLATFTGVEIPV